MGGHHHEGQDPWQQHHYDDMDQQYEAGKLGMWLFLATEVLLFAGLFCAYTVYRYNNPEVWEHAAAMLDWKLGALNTIVLLFSSLTAAWAVRAAQLKQKQLCTALLGITIACGAVFMVVKYFEYSHKFHLDELWGTEFDPALEQPQEVHKAKYKAKLAAEATEGESQVAAAPLKDSPVGYKVVEPGAELRSSSKIEAPPMRAEAEAVEKKAETPEAYSAGKVRNVHIFFGIYFCMTGLHGLHVLIGMLVLGWLLWRNNRGDFDTGHFLPVDLGALYWHLVDLIWIFLFPLLYLI